MVVRISRLVRGLTIGGLVIVFLLAAFRPVTFMADKYWFPTAVLLSGTALLLLLIHQGVPGLRQLTTKSRQRLVWVSWIIILFVQLFVAWNFVDYGRADAYFVRNQAVRLAMGNLQWNHYFQVYTNNVNLVLVEAVLIKMGLLVGLHHPWIMLNILQFAWLDCGLLAGFKLLTWRHQPVAALLLIWFWLLSIPVYAYGLFSYSDGLIMPLPLIVAALVLKIKKLSGPQRSLPIIISVGLVTFGVLIKGNLVILLFALVLALIMLGWQREFSWLLVGLWVTGLVAGLLLGITATNFAAKQAGYRSDPNAALPVTSWVAMSLDPQTHGDYRSSDALAQMQLPTASAKQQSERQLIQQRVTTMGPVGLLLHLGQKAQLLLATGDMDSFRLTTQWQKIPQWYAIQQVQINFWLANWMQILYLVILLGALRFLILHWRSENLLLALFMLGLMVFHIIFWEVEERYALPLLPILLLWASQGWAVVGPIQITDQQKRWLSWLVVPILGFNLWAMLAVTTVKITPNRIVNEQGVGGYFQPTTMALAPGKTLITEIQTVNTSNRLEILPRGMAHGRVSVNLLNSHGAVAAQTGDSKQLNLLKYAKQPAEKMQLRITNHSSQPLRYGIGTADYPLANAIQGRPTSYLRYYVLNQNKQPLRLTRSAVPILLTGLALISFWGSFWWHPLAGQTFVRPSVPRR